MVAGITTLDPIIKQNTSITPKKKGRTSYKLKCRIYSKSWVNQLLLTDTYTYINLKKKVQKTMDKQ